MSSIDAATFDQLATPILWLDGQGAVYDCNAAFSSWLSVGKRRLLGVGIDQLDYEHPRLHALCMQCLQPEERMQALRLQLRFAEQRERFADAIVEFEAALRAQPGNASARTYLERARSMLSTAPQTSNTRKR